MPAERAVDVTIQHRHNKLTSVDKAMVVLRALLEPGDPQRLTDLSRRTGLAKSTVHRLLVSLSAHRMVVQRDGRYVSVMRLDEPGEWLDEDFVNLVRTQSSPFLMELCRLTKAQVGVYARSGEQIRLINQVQARHILTEGFHDAKAAASYAANTMLAAYGAEPDHASELSGADISRIRRGVVYRLDNSGRQSVTAVAVPIFEPTFFPWPVALTVSGLTDPNSVRWCTRALQDIGGRLTRQIGSCVTASVGAA